MGKKDYNTFRSIFGASVSMKDIKVSGRKKDSLSKSLALYTEAANMANRKKKKKKKKKDNSFDLASALGYKGGSASMSEADMPRFLEDLVEFGEEIYLAGKSLKKILIKDIPDNNAIGILVIPIFTEDNFRYCLTSFLMMYGEDGWVALNPNTESLDTVFSVIYDLYKDLDPDITESDVASKINEIDDMIQVYYWNTSFDYAVKVIGYGVTEDRFLPNEEMTDMDLESMIANAIDIDSEDDDEEDDEEEENYTSKSYTTIDSSMKDISKDTVVNSFTLYNHSKATEESEEPGDDASTTQIVDPTSTANDISTQTVLTKEGENEYENRE